MSTDDLLARAKEFYERGTKLTEGIVLVGELAAELERLRAELARVRPVVDAAVAWAEVWAAGSVADDERRALLLAVGRLWNETQGTGQ